LTYDVVISPVRGERLTYVGEAAALYHEHSGARIVCSACHLIVCIMFIRRGLFLTDYFVGGNPFFAGILLPSITNNEREERKTVTFLR
jgi:hypothetical protein